MCLKKGETVTNMWYMGQESGFRDQNVHLSGIRDQASGVCRKFSIVFLSDILIKFFLKKLKSVLHSYIDVLFNNINGLTSYISSYIRLTRLTIVVYQRFFNILEIVNKCFSRRARRKRLFFSSKISVETLWR